MQLQEYLYRHILAEVIATAPVAPRLPAPKDTRNHRQHRAARSQETRNYRNLYHKLFQMEFALRRPTAHTLPRPQRRPTAKGSVWVAPPAPTATPSKAFLEALVFAHSKVSRRGQDIG